jgi:hypothetical protein
MRQAKLLLCELMVLLIMSAAQSTAWAQQAQNYTIGPFEITGFYQYTIYPATEQANQNNFACLSGPCQPGLQQRRGKPDFLLMRQLLDLNIFGKFSENWSVTLEPRFFFDMTKIVDSHFRQYESLPQPFRGNGWMLRGGGNDFKAEMWQAYADYRGGDWWIRFGKQQIAWGEALGLRVLDIVNPLDLSQNLAFDRIFEEFDRVRIPQWFARVDYTIPNESIPDLTAEFILNPGIVVPTILPPQGSPLNVVPALLQIRDHVKQGEPTAGGRLTGTVSEVQFSVNFVTKPNDNAIGVFKFIPPAGVSLGCASPPFDPTDCQVVLGARHPRIYIVGGSANYNWAQAGAVLRAETTVTTNSPFLRSINATPVSIIDRGVWKMMLGVDRPTYVFPGLDSMTIGLQFLETFTGGDLHGVADSAGTKVDKAVQQFTIFFQQPLLSKRVLLEFFGMLDTGDGYWLQPGVHWEVGDHIRLDAYYNHFAGSENRAPGARFGGFFSFANGPFFRFTYGF